MAPTTRRQAAQQKLGEAQNQKVTAVVDQTPPDPPSVRKTKKPKKIAKTLSTKGVTPRSVKVTRSTITKKKTKKAVVKYDREGDPRIGMKGFLPNGLPDTGNEMFIPGYVRGLTTAVSVADEVLVAGLVQEVLFENTIGKNAIAEMAAAVNGIDGSALASSLKHISANANDAEANGGAQAATNRHLDLPSHEERIPGALKALHDPNAPFGSAVEIPDALMPTLTNDIHDIWDRARHDHWKFDSQLSHNQDWRIYEILTPAMRLASLWLTRPEYQKFWTGILYGSHKPDGKHNTRNLADHEIEVSTPKDVEKRLRDIAKKLHFRFAPLADGKWAHTEIISRRNSNSWRGTTFEPGYVTTLHDDFMYIPWPGAVPPVWKDSNTCSKLRFLFLLAVQLSGQLAEVLWMDRCEREGKGESCAKDGRVSISQAFEAFVLGGRLQVVNNVPNPFCLEGLAITTLDHVASFAKVELLSMHGINARFAQAWWAPSNNGSF